MKDYNTVDSGLDATGTAALDIDAIEAFGIALMRDKLLSSEFEPRKRNREPASDKEIKAASKRKAARRATKLARRRNRKAKQ